MIILIIIAIMLGITTKAVKENRNLNFLEKTIKDSTSFIVNIINKPIDFVKDKIKENKEKNDIYKKYKKYKDKALKTDVSLARIKELEKQVNTLKESLDLNSTLTEYDKINANVINRNVGNWYNVLTIDKGSKSGIKNGMAVVIKQGLIGKIISVSNFTSSVKLLSTDELSNKISVKIKIDNHDVYGLLTNYDKSKNVYLIEGISNSDEIKKDSEVVTTGLSEIFPSGILVGKVKKVRVDNYELAKVVEVTPSVDFDDISIVTVLDRNAKSK